MTRTSPADHRASLALVRRFFLLGAALLAVLQVVVDPSLENLLCVMLAVASFAAACVLLLQPASARGGAPLTAAATLLSVSSNSVVPMLGTLVDGNSLIVTLAAPVATFFHRALFDAVLLAAHFAVTRSSLLHFRDRLGLLLDKARVRKLLDPRHVLMLGMLGIVVSMAKLFLLPEGSVLKKVADGFAFAWTVPFILLSPPYMAWFRAKPFRKWLLVGYYLLGIVIGVTSRMALIAPLAVAFSANLVALLAGYTRVGRRTLPFVVIMGICSVFALSVLKDFSTAILVERAYRDFRNPMENLQATWETFKDKETLRRAELTWDQSLSEESWTWREDYLQNPFLARFTSVKYDDNLLSRMDRFGEDATAFVRESTSNRVWAVLPEPLLPLFDLNFDKNEVNSYSMGDLMYSLGAGINTQIGMRTGSVLAHGYLLYGWLYPLVLFLVLVPYFMVMQAVGTLDHGGRNGYGTSAFALLYAFPLFLSFSFESWHVILHAVVRNIWQTLLIYALLVWICRVFVRERRLRPVGQPA